MARKVLHTNDTPHAVALGAGIATFVALLPLIGFQTVIALALAAVFRANKAICIPVVWITNPFTAIPIFKGCFELGRFVLTGPSDRTQASVLAELELQQNITLFESERRSLESKPTENFEAYQAYVHKLNLLHEMLVFSMKAKQSTDLGIVENLESLLEQFRGVYLGD